MMKKTFHILVVAVLAFNLMGAWAFSTALDCGMECCAPNRAAQAGVPALHAPSCCQMDGITCGFETGRYEEIFDSALCCHTAIQKIPGGWGQAALWRFLEPFSRFKSAHAEVASGPPRPAPLYLTNASFLC